MAHRSVRVNGRPVVYRMEATVSSKDDVHNVQLLVNALHEVGMEKMTNLRSKPAPSVIAHARDACKLYKLFIVHVFRYSSALQACSCGTQPPPALQSFPPLPSHTHRHDTLLQQAIDLGCISSLTRIATHKLVAAHSIVASLRKRGHVRLPDVQHVADALVSMARGALDVLRGCASRVPAAADMLARSGLIHWIAQHAANRGSLLHGYAVDYILRLVPLTDESAVMAHQLDKALWTVLENCDAAFAVQVCFCEMMMMVITCSTHHHVHTTTGRGVFCVPNAASMA